MQDNYDVGIIDYGINNLKSISKAFEKIGKRPKIIDTPEGVMSSRCLILPGVGAFEDGMNGLKERGLIEPLNKKVEDGTPLLGICLGMQMLFSESYEFGQHRGLGLIPGKVIAFKPPSEVNIPGYKVPHIGWNNIQNPSDRKESIWDRTLLEGTELHANVYFVHSFYPVADNPEEVVATSEYGNQEFAAVVKRNNVIGTQFHPEKSGIVGLDMLKKFCEINNI